MRDDNVIQMPDRPKPPVLDEGGHVYDGLLCDCGSAWFTATVCLDAESKVTGYAADMVCRECGRAV